MTIYKEGMHDMMKTAFVVALGMIMLCLAACGRSESDTKTLYEGEALKIEREGAITHIYDNEGGGEYVFTKHRTRTQAEPVETASPSIHTRTIDIKTAHGLIIVTTADGNTFYIK